jgi:preprotein translocase subunit SecD
MGIEPGPVAGGPLVAPTPPGALPAVQGRMGQFGDVNGPLGVVPPLDAQGRPMPTVPPPVNPAGPPTPQPPPAEGAPGAPPVPTPEGSTPGH